MAGDGTPRIFSLPDKCWSFLTKWVTLVARTRCPSPNDPQPCDPRLLSRLPLVWTRQRTMRTPGEKSCGGTTEAFAPPPPPPPPSATPPPPQRNSRSSQRPYP